MYERILRDEFALPDGSRADPKAGKGSGPRPKAAAQLASAMGLTQLMLPFRLGTATVTAHPPGRPCLDSCTTLLC